MKIAIMQPYFLPYIGYFQLMNSVDEFVIYDNIQYTKKGWINRNRILVNGQDAYITLPLKRDSDYFNVSQRFLSDSWFQDRKKLLNKISASYRKAPYYLSTFPLIEECLLFEDSNLFYFILNSIKLVNRFLNIQTSLVISSSINIDHTLKAEKRIIAICKARNAVSYINPIGGTKLYRGDEFDSEGIKLFFLQTKDISYKQFDNGFVPWLSIIDVLMFNSVENVWRYLSSSFKILEGK